MLVDDLMELIPLRDITKQRIEDLDQEFLERLIKLLSAMPPRLLRRLTIGSAKRYPEEQERAWQAYQGGYGGLAARPGTSRHEFGEAVDFWPAVGIAYNPNNRRYRQSLKWLYENAPRFGIRGLSTIDGKGKMHHNVKDLIHFQKMTIGEWQRAEPNEEQEYPENVDLTQEPDLPWWDRALDRLANWWLPWWK